MKAIVVEMTIHQPGKEDIRLQVEITTDEADESTVKKIVWKQLETWQHIQKSN